jgi:uncharacterized membrane protein YkvA (DUF1232 family)
MFKRLGLIGLALKGDLRLLWRALRHPQSPGWFKLGVAALLFYLILPIDLIPDVIPLVGAIDDVLILTLGVKWLLKRLPADMLCEIRG